MSNCFRYGFRIVGDCNRERRLVDWPAAFSAYANCDERTELDKGGFLSAFLFDESIRTRCDPYERLSMKGCRAQCYALWVWLDVDREGDLPAATLDARRLGSYLADRYSIDDELLIFFSGSKGYHLGLPVSLFDASPSEHFGKYARALAEEVSQQCNAKIDSQVYDTVRPFRAPNSRHPKTGLYKRALTFDELLGLHVEGLKNLAQSPQPFDYPANTKPNAIAIEDWKRAVERVSLKTVGRRTAGDDSRLNRQTFEFIREGATPGERQLRLFRAAANLAELGAPLRLCESLLTESALNSGLTPSEAKRQIECGFNHATRGTDHEG